MTRQRQVIIEELRKVKTHPTAGEIYSMVRVKMPKISLGTVYRNLDYLAANGDIRKLEIAGTIRRYDGDISGHHHVRCMGCGKVDDLFDLQVGNLKEKAEKMSDYSVTDYTVEFTGFCSGCRKKS